MLISFVGKARIMPLRAGVPHGLAVFAVARCSVENPEVYTVAVAGAPALVGRWPALRFPAPLVRLMLTY